MWVEANLRVTGHSPYFPEMRAASHRQCPALCLLGAHVVAVHTPLVKHLISSESDRGSKGDRSTYLIDARNRLPCFGVSSFHMLSRVFGHRHDA